MRRAIRVRLTYANVVSSLCLFILLGGVSWAATTLPRNSVGSKQIKRNAVKSSKVRNGSLSASDLSARARASLRGQQGPAGAAGAAGAKGDTGPKGDTGAKGETGAQGETGPRGPSDAWSSFRYLTTQTTNLNTSVTLPAGNYVLHGKAVASQSGGQAVFLAMCTIQAPAETFDDAGPQTSFAQALIGPDASASTTLNTLRTIALQAETVVTLYCGVTKTDQNAGTAGMSHLTLVATKVETLN